MMACAPRLEVGEQRLWRNVSIESLRVLEFPHSCVFDDREDELCSILPRRLVGTALGPLGSVRGFRARTDDGHGIVDNRRVVSSRSCGFNKFRSVACCVRCHPAK